MRLFAAVLAFISVVSAFNNPFFWQDVPDLDIRRINNTYYYSASSFHYSPGAPILRSYDLIHWEFIGHSVPKLEAFGSAYTLTNGQRAYRAGIWASFFNYHTQKDTWFWGGCTDFWYSHIFSAPSVTGPWNMIATIPKCYYDCGLLIDDDGTMYVSHVENNTIWVAQLSADGTTEVKSQQVWVPPDNIGSFLSFLRNHRSCI
jgi:beta-xylosidase